MLMRTDPFRELDRLTQQVFGTDGTLARPAVDADGRLAGAATPSRSSSICPESMPESIDLDVERHVVTVKAERPARQATPNWSQPNGPAECSADNWSWATTSTPSASPPATTPGYSPWRSRSPSRPSPARSRSATSGGDRQAINA